MAKYVKMTPKYAKKKESNDYDSGLGELSRFFESLTAEELKDIEKMLGGPFKGRK